MIPTTARTRTSGPDAAALAELLARCRPGYSLPAPFYGDPAVFALDSAAIFAAHWVFVASEAEIRGPGDYVVVDIGSASLIVLRERDGGIRALRNVCRHRGARVVRQDRGTARALVCGYHQWTYATDGRLSHAGQQAPGFDPECFGLKQVAVRNVAGLVFVCLAQTPPTDWDDVATRTAPYLAPHRIDRMKVAAQDDLVERGNWKLVMENNRECYHCPAAHPELLRTFFPTYGYAPDEIPTRLRAAYERYLAAESDLLAACEPRGLPVAEIEELSGRPSAFRIQREPLDGAGESYTLDGKAACSRLVGDFDSPRLGRLSLHHQPNSWFHFLADHAVTFAVLPIDATTTRVRTTWLVHEDAVEGVDYDLATLTEVWRRTNEQDGALVAWAQAGVDDPGYEPGPYAPSEYQVDAFVAWYRERLHAHLGR